MESQRTPAPGDAGLADVKGARANLARRIVPPRWYHPVVAVLIAQHVLVQGAHDRNWTLPSGVLLVVGCALAWLGWRRHMGVTIGPWTGWRSLLTLGMWSLLVLVCASAAAAAGAADPLVVVALSLAAATGSFLLGRGYDRALRADVHDADSSPSRG